MRIAIRGNQMEYIVYYKKGLSTEEVEQVNAKGWTPETLEKTAGVFVKDLSVIKIFKDYAAVATVEAENEDEVFAMMNRMGTQPSQLILKWQGVKHTSMSVGDVVLNRKTMEVLQCSDEGWEKVQL